MEKNEYNSLMFKMHTDLEKNKAVNSYYMDIHAKLCYRMEKKVFKRMPPSMVLARRKTVRSESVKHSSSVMKC